MEEWFKTSQGQIIMSLASSGVTLAQGKSNLTGKEKQKWVLTFIYDRLDEMNNWPDWIDFFAKEVVIKLLPELVELVYGHLLDSGALNFITGEAK